MVAGWKRSTRGKDGAQAVSSMLVWDRPFGILTAGEHPLSEGMSGLSGHMQAFGGYLAHALVRMEHLVPMLKRHQGLRWPHPDGPAVSAGPGAGDAGLGVVDAPRRLPRAGAVGEQQGGSPAGGLRCLLPVVQREGVLHRRLRVRHQRRSAVQVRR